MTSPVASVTHRVKSIFLKMAFKALHSLIFSSLFLLQSSLLSFLWIYQQPFSLWASLLLFLLCGIPCHSLSPERCLRVWAWLSFPQRGLLEFCPPSKLGFPSSSSFFFLGLHLWHMQVPRLGGWIRTAAAGLHHSQSNAGSKPHLQTTAQMAAMLES